MLVIDQDNDGAIDTGDLTLNWQAQTFLFDNRGYAYTTISYSMSDERDFNAIRLLGLLPVSFTFRILNGLDMNVGVATDDELYPVGTPGASDFRAVVLDNVNKVGFSHGGIYTDDNVIKSMLRTPVGLLALTSSMLRLPTLRMLRSPEMV